MTCLFSFYAKRLLIAVCVFLALLVIFGFFIALVAAASIGNGAIECFDLVMDRVME